MPRVTARRVVAQLFAIAIVFAAAGGGPALAAEDRSNGAVFTQTNAATGNALLAAGEVCPGRR